MKPALFATALAALALALAPKPVCAMDAPDPHAEAWRNDESIAFAEARSDGRHVVVVFGADWCLPCKKIDEIMNGEIVFGLLSENFVPLYFDITELSERDEALQAKYKVPTLPAVIFVDATGQELGRWRQNLSPGGFIGAMRSVLASHPRTTAMTSQ